MFNSLINKLPWEMHLPGYQFCGPGTKLDKRIRHGDKGINQLDAFCKKHDIAYLKNKSLENRHIADWILQNEAWNRVKAKDAKFNEKINAWLVTTAMKLKHKLGMGLNKHRIKQTKNKQVFKKKKSFKGCKKKLKKKQKKYNQYLFKKYTYL